MRRGVNNARIQQLEETVRTLLNRQEVLEGSLKGAEQKNSSFERYIEMMGESTVLKDRKISDLEQRLEQEIRMRQEAEREVMVMMRDRKEQMFVTNDGKPLTAEILVELETRSEKLGLLEQHSWLRSDEFLCT